MKTGKVGEFFEEKEVEDLGDGFVLIEREDDYCATAYWYMDCPTNSLPPLAPPAERMEDLPKE